MVDETVIVNKETNNNATKEYTNDDIIIFLSALPVDERDILINNNDFASIKRFLDKETNKRILEEIDVKIEYLKLLQKSVKHLYLADKLTDKEENKVDRILKLYNTLDDEKKIKVNSKMQKEDNMDVAIGKLCDNLKDASEKFKGTIPKLEGNR